MVLIIELAILLATSIAPFLFSSILLHKHGLMKSYRTVAPPDPGPGISKPPDISSAGSASLSATSDAFNLAATQITGSDHESPATTSATETFFLSPTYTTDYTMLKSVCYYSGSLATFPTAKETDLLYPAIGHVNHSTALASVTIANSDNITTMGSEKSITVDNVSSDLLASLVTVSSVSPVHALFSGVSAVLVFLALVFLVRRLRISAINRKRDKAAVKASLHHRKKVLIKPSTASQQLLFQPSQPKREHFFGLDSLQNRSLNAELVQVAELQQRYRPYFQCGGPVNHLLITETNGRHNENRSQDVQLGYNESKSQDMQSGVAVDTGSFCANDLESKPVEAVVDTDVDDGDKGDGDLSAMDINDCIRQASHSEINPTSHQADDIATLQNTRYIPPHKRRRSFHGQSQAPHQERKRVWEGKQTVFIRNFLESLDPSQELANLKAAGGTEEDRIRNGRARKVAIVGTPEDKKTPATPTMDERKKNVRVVSESESSVVNWRRVLAS